ncbi:hypothetical protein ACQ4PT_002830 [Festuca glaucescens]
MAAANSSGLTSPVGGAGAGREGGIEGEGGDGELANLGGLLSVVDSSDLTSATAAAGAGRDGAVDGEGGAGAGREDGVDGEVADLGGQVAADVDCCGSSNPSTLMFYSPEKAAAIAVAKVWKENPASSSRFTAGFVGGIDLDDEIWDVRFNLDGQDNLGRCLGRSDITYLNLLAIIELEGYGINDCMYFVKEKDIGVAGMEELDGMSKVEQMIELYEEKKCINISVIKRGSSLPVNINKPAVEEQIPMSEIGYPIVYTVDDDGVSNIDDKGKQNVDEQREVAAGCTDDEEEEIAEGCSDDEQEQIAEDREESSDDDQDGDFMEEDEVETESDEESELNEKLIDLKKRKRAGSKQLCEDEEPEDIFCDSDNSDDDTDCEVLQETVAENREEASAAPAAPPSAAPAAPPSATQASSAPAPAAPKRKKASAPLNPPPWKRNTGASAVATAPAAPKRKSPSAGASAAAPPSKKKAASTEASGSTTTAGPRASAPAVASRAYAAPSARASAAPSARASAAATTAVAPFKVPRPARERRESTRMKGYLTASNIDNLTMADIKKGVL